MHLSLFAATLLPLASSAINVVQSNDDGWAEINIRRFYEVLNDAVFDSIISAPAENKSGTGSLHDKPEKVDDGCEFDSCPPGSPPTGQNASMPNIYYVNSYPVTAMRYGIKRFSPKHFNGPPDIAVAGPNVGSNFGLVTQFSGTVGAATEAVKEGIPAIAFSGSSGSQTAWNEPVKHYVNVYADLATNITQTVAHSGKPYLPKNVWLNVNFPALGSHGCHKTADFKFVLSRIHHAVPFITDDDVETCGNGGRLPVEEDVVHTNGCYASIAVGKADDKLDADAKQQRKVLRKLRGMLSCLP